MVKTAQHELNFASSQRSSHASTQGRAKPQLPAPALNKQVSAVVSIHSRSKKAAAARDGISSPPQPSPLKLRRSASFIESSPAKGSLIVEQQKRLWANQQKMQILQARKAPQPAWDAREDQEMRQSEGNALDTASHKWRDPTRTSQHGRASENFLRRPDFDGVNRKLLTIKLEREASEASLEPFIGAADSAIAGHKANPDDSVIMTDYDEEGEDSDSFRPIAPTTTVKLNKAEEEAMLKELEQEALENDPILELDRALMDRHTAQLNIRGRVQPVVSKSKVNTSNFNRGSQAPAQLLKRLKQLGQQQQMLKSPYFEVSFEGRPA